MTYREKPSTSDAKIAEPDVLLKPDKRVELLSILTFENNTKPN